jgi:uncharacterized membrane protein YkoI
MRTPTVSKLALISAAAMTAFTVVVGGAVAPLLTRPTPGAQEAAQGPVGADPTAEDILAAVLAERERAYLDALAQAQAQLDEAARQRAVLESAAEEARRAYDVAAARAREQGEQLLAQQALLTAAAAAPAVQVAVAAPAAEVPPIVQAAAAPVALAENAVPALPTIPAGAVAAARPPAPVAGFVPAPAPPFSDRISRETAIQIGRAATGGAAPKEVELKTERGTLAYSIEFPGDGKALVEAATGQVLLARPVKTSGVRLSGTRRDDD